MRGLVKSRRGDGFLHLETSLKEAPTGPEEIKVKVEAAGICGSDIHIFHDTINIPIVPPVIIGHEFSGYVVEKGKDLKNTPVKVGDKVTVEPTFQTCGFCLYCREGYYNLCSQRKILGYTANGCFAEYCNGTHFHILPENVSFRAGALTELLASTIHGVVEQTKIDAGDIVLISGPGPLGICALMVTLIEGGIPVVCGTERDVKRLELAKELGALETIIIDKESVAEKIMDLTSGYGADIVLECAGVESSANLCLDLVKKRGKYCQMGLFGSAVQFDLEKVAFKEIYMGGFISQKKSSWERAIRFMELGKIDSEKLISHTFRLDRWEEAFGIMEEKDGLKVILVP